MISRLFSLFLSLSFLLIVSKASAQIDFSFLVYDPDKVYAAGSSVIESTSKPGEIYTAKIEVPKGQNGPPNSTYWSSSSEYTTQLTQENSSSLSTVPNSDVVNTSEIANLDTPEDSNESTSVPVFAVGATASVSFQENNTSSVYTASATGANSYSISGGDDASLFTINTATGELSFNSTPDYEKPVDNGSNNSYSVTITATNDNGSAELSITVVVTDDASESLSGGRLINLSTRGYVGAGAKRMVGGFRVYGDQLEVLVRGFGPSRPNDDNLDDPILTWKTNPTSLLPSSSGIVSEVDDATGNTRLSGVITSTQELLDDLVDKETADIQTVSNWDNNSSLGYTAFITNKDGTDEGIGRIGINDLSGQSGNGQLVNIATRAYVGDTNAQYLIAGFQIRGGSVKVCIRAFGPSRPNVDALSDPQIELIQQKSDFHSEKLTLAWNDDYNLDYDDGSIQTANSSAAIPDYLNTLIDKESAILITLPEGDYSAKVSGVGGVTGIGRVGIDKVID